MDKGPLRLSISNLGAPTSPLVAKQLEEFSKSLNQGMKNVEIGTISADKFEFIPKQHFDEIRRLAKLTDSHVSVHAPLVDLAGFATGEGGGGAWREEQRKTTEEQVFSILERTYKMSNGENVPVVFHAGHTFSQEYEKGAKRIKRNPETGEVVTRKEIINGKEEDVPVIEQSDIRAIGVVNADTGQMTRMDYEEKYSIGKDKKTIWDPFTRLHSLNSTQWDDEKLKLFNYQKEIEDLKEKLNLKLKQNEAMEKSGLIADKDYQSIHQQNVTDITRMERHISEINRRLGSSYDDVYNKFRQFANPKLQKDYEKTHEGMKKQYKDFQERIETVHDEAEKLAEKFQKAEKGSHNAEAQKLKEDYHKKMLNLSELQSMQSKIIVNDIAQMKTPEIWKPVSDFAIEKTAETVSGAVAKMYLRLRNEGKEKQTPFVALENFFVNSPMSRAEDLRKAIEESRKKLVKKLVEDSKGKVKEDEAKKAAENLIAATWDVGHINNLRKAGWEGKELKEEVLKETEKIASLVRHVHITDNFGFHDSHLPPGMGNVPIREIMEKLEKRWSELEDQGKLKSHPRSIVEAGGFVAEIGANPTVNILEFFGSPLYKMAQGPYWGGENVPIPSRAAFTYTPYREAYIEFPQQHFNLYGSSFTTLPKSVGGQVGGEGSRFSGTPNQ